MIRSYTVTLNKWGIETLSCVCGYCTYGKYLSLCLLINIKKKTTGKSGVGCVQFYPGVNGLNKKNAPKKSAIFYVSLQVLLTLYF